MTFTPKYIEMCRQATEIQKLKEINNSGDFQEYKYDENDFIYAYDRVRQVDNDYYSMVYTGEFATERRLFWLPAFEQWIEIYRANNPTSYESITITRFSEFVVNNMEEDRLFCSKYESKEELVMIFVMDKIYRKAWDFRVKVWR